MVGVCVCVRKGGGGVAGGATEDCDNPGINLATCSSGEDTVAIDERRRVPGKTLAISGEERHERKGTIYPGCRGFVLNTESQATDPDGDTPTVCYVIKFLAEIKMNRKSNILKNKLHRSCSFFLLFSFFLNTGVPFVVHDYKKKKLQDKKKNSNKQHKSLSQVTVNVYCCKNKFK